MAASTPIVLSIAGSDSSAGAGIQADIKAISATGAYACTVITATTAQNTLGVTDIHSIPSAHVAAQLEAVFDDLDIQAVKIGMLANLDIIQTVAAKLRQYAPKNVVLDPVMVSTSGRVLLQENAIDALKNELFPLATIVTPNLPEAAALLGKDMPTNEQALLDMVPALRALPMSALLLKGGHFCDCDESKDWLINPSLMMPYSAPRINTRNTHGTGCTLSSAIASYLAQGDELVSAVSKAKDYVSQAIAHADQLAVGKGHGPLHHFFKMPF